MIFSEIDGLSEVTYQQVLNKHHWTDKDNSLSCQSEGYVSLLNWGKPKTSQEMDKTLHTIFLLNSKTGTVGVFMQWAIFMQWLNVMISSMIF